MDLTCPQLSSTIIWTFLFFMIYFITHTTSTRARVTPTAMTRNIEEENAEVDDGDGGFPQNLTEVAPKAGREVIVCVRNWTLPLAYCKTIPINENNARARAARKTQKNKEIFYH
ncbi:hypothetical protein GQX74_012330 [Glossina fuscipes]|nr:hypothetical protein GQX74_012330 [Glossina fuscipes]